MGRSRPVPLEASPAKSGPWPTAKEPKRPDAKPTRSAVEDQTNKKSFAVSELVKLWRVT